MSILFNRSMDLDNDNGHRMENMYELCQKNEAKVHNIKSKKEGMFQIV